MSRLETGTESADAGTSSSAGGSVGREDRSGLLAAVKAVARDVLAPAAASCDTGEVPASHLRALAAAGVFGLSGPDGPAAVERVVQETLARACAATWFVQLQHHGTATVVRRALLGGRTSVAVGSSIWDTAQLSARLLAGDLLGGVAVAHVRRPDRPVRAARVPGGWRIDGRVAWYTGWGLNDVMMLAAVADDGSVVIALVPAVADEHVVPGQVQRPLAMAGTRTVSLDLRGLVVTDEAVLDVEAAADFAAADAQRTANANPAVFGVCAASILNLGSEGGAAATLAKELEERRVELRARAWQLLDEVPAGEEIERRLAVRAAAGELAVRAATAEVVAAGGRGLIPGHPAQRHAREALFLLTQAQTSALRAAQLELLGDRG